MKPPLKTTKSSRQTKVISTIEIATSGTGKSDTKPSDEKLRITEVQSTPTEGNVLRDEGKGEPVIVREYKIKVVPSKHPFEIEKMLLYHKPNILMTLRKDGWEPLHEPIIKKHSDTSYSIYIQARIRRSMIGGTPAFTIREKPTLLQDVFKK